MFLISLKAGGTGLNLTAADVVIHYDPWWNLAAQNQATDRAHRMGQQASVHVYKLIAKDTIEEKSWSSRRKKSRPYGDRHRRRWRAAPLHVPGGAAAELMEPGQSAGACCKMCFIAPRPVDREIINKEFTALRCC